jgi:hypothetical protein
VLVLLAVVFMVLIVPLILLFLIEPSGVPLESIQEVWASHWFWGCCFGRGVGRPPKPQIWVWIADRLRGAGGRGKGGGGEGGEEEGKEGDGAGPEARELQDLRGRLAAFSKAWKEKGGGSSVVVPNET